MSFLLDQTSTLLCTHGAPVTHVPSQVRVTMSGAPALVVADTNTIAGCPFTLPGGKVSPCIKVQWVAPATRVFLSGQPALLQTSTGFGLSPEQAPQGPPSVVAVQPRVRGM